MMQRWGDAGVNFFGDCKKRFCIKVMMGLQATNIGQRRLTDNTFFNYLGQFNLTRRANNVFAGRRFSEL